VQYVTGYRLMLCRKGKNRQDWPRKIASLAKSATQKKLLARGEEEERIPVSATRHSLTRVRDLSA